MEKRILLGSIIAVVILILVSFTSVVGFQSVKSTSGKASPLFTVRSKRAIDKESKDLNCDYVGKGKENVISVPSIVDRFLIVQPLIDKIKQMGDADFNRFIDFVRGRAHHIHRLKNLNPDQMKNALCQLRESPKLLNLYYEMTKAEHMNCGENTTFFVTPTFPCWFPGCLILAIPVLAIVFMIIMILG